RRHTRSLRDWSSDVCSSDLAMIRGPARLVGKPRRVERATSHVDLMPTILAMLGDHRPSAAVGSNLFGPPRSSRWSALAIRQGGKIGRASCREREEMAVVAVG